MKKKFILWVIIFIANIKISYGQNPNFYERTNIIGKSPVVSEFMKYDELPVSEYTGIPNISIPLYEIDSKTLKIPLTLAYHAGGLKVTQEASWVGLGWDLTLDTKIVQIVKDEDDIRVFYHAYANFVYPNWVSNGGSYYTSFQYSTCGTPVITGNSFPVYSVVKDFGFAISTFGYMPVNGRYIQKDNMLGGIDDSEPDIFRITIRGETLSCIFEAHKYSSGIPRIIVLNKKGYSVKYTGEESGQWEVIDPDGNKYYFSTHSDVENLSMNRTYCVQSRIWFLDKLITVNGEEINYNYVNIGAFYTVLNPSTKTIPITSHNTVLTCNYGGCATGYISQHPNFNTKKSPSIDTCTWLKETQYYLSSIQFPNGSITFSMSNRTDIPGKRKLDKISVYNNNNETVKKTVFTYDYYSGTDNKSRKLKLISIKINDENPYLFFYDNQSLPSINSCATDYWGYYNGQTSNSSLVPNPVRWKNKFPYNQTFEAVTSLSNPEVTYNNHSARLQYTKAGILEKIQYPTGGKTTFEYELNQFLNYWVPDYDSLTNNISKGHGLRVNKIRFLDYSGNSIKEEHYAYSGGKAITPLRFFHFIWYNYVSVPLFKIGVAGSANSSIDAVYYKILNCSTSGNYADNPLSSFSGVGYDKVIKQTIGAGNISNGSIETYYNNTPDKTGIHLVDFGEAPQNNLPAFKDSSKPENGTIKKRVYYNAAGIKEMQETFEYRNKESPLYYGVNIRGYSLFMLRCFHPEADRTIDYYERCLFGYYPVFDFESLLEQKTTIQYFGVDSIVNIENYSYNSNNFLSYMEQTSSNGGYCYSVYYYPQYYTEDIYKRMVAKNIISPKIRTLTGCYGKTTKIKHIHYTDDNTITKGLILPKDEEIFRYDGQNANESKTFITYDKYDSSGNILQYTDANNISVTYVWGYNHQYPIAELKNSTYAQLTSKIQETTLMNISAKIAPSSTDWDMLNNLRTQLPDAQITTYKYRPLVGFDMITAPNGMQTYYGYDNSGRLLWIADDKSKTIKSYEYHYTD
ncbi:MAG: hypothetical protein LBS69_06590 [Prevotellaceae bacterium]|jgi:hypothetical protein|nr:hypothetical protein [Prevotellaceae bacterium]